jgi:hypothetical protein
MGSYGSRVRTDLPARAGGPWAGQCLCLLPVGTTDQADEAYAALNRGEMLGVPFTI